MSNLEIHSFKETQQSFNWLEHELIIIINVMHFAVVFYYFLYELLVLIFSLFGYPRLPTLVFAKNGWKYVLGEWLSSGLKIIMLIGAFLGFIGSANWNLIFTIISCLICLPFVGADLYSFANGKFHQIDVDDFLLFQTLFTSTIRSVRVFATIANIALIFHFLFRLPTGLSFSQFL